MLNKKRDAKVLNIHYLRKFFAIIPFILSAFVAYKSPQIGLILSTSTSVLTLFLIIILITPIGRIKLNHSNPEYSNLQFYGSILIGIVTFFIIIYSQVVAFFNYGPQFLKDLVNINHITTVYYEFSINEWGGAFPWNIYLLWGMSLAYFTYNHHGVPFHHRHAAVIWSGYLGSIGKLMTEYVVIFSSATIYLLSTGTTLILIYQGLKGYFLLPDYYLSVYPTLIFLLPFILFMWLILSKSNLRKLTKKNITINFLLLISLFLGLILMFLSAWFGENLTQLMPTLKNYTCSCIEHYQKQGPDIRLSLVIWSGLMIWAPLAGTYLARLIKGRTIRELIIAGGVIPTLIMFLIYQNKGLITINLSSSVLLALGAMNLLIICFFFYKQKNSIFFSAGFMPIKYPYRSGVNKLSEGSKIYNIVKFGRFLILGPITIIYFHALGGWLLIQFIIVTLSPLIIIKSIACMIIAFITQCYRDLRKF